MTCTYIRVCSIGDGWDEQKVLADCKGQGMVRTVDRDRVEQSGCFV